MTSEDIVIFELARFFHVSPLEIAKLSYNQFLQFVEAMNILKARERLEWFDRLSYPHSTDDRRKKAHKETYKTAYPYRFREENSVSLDEAFKIISRII